MSALYYLSRLDAYDYLDKNIKNMKMFIWPSFKQDLNNYLFFVL